MTRPTLVALTCLAFVGTACARTEPAPVTRAAPEPTSSAASVASVASVATVAPTAPGASNEARPANPSSASSASHGSDAAAPPSSVTTLDAPPWPTAAKPALKLTWAVYPPVGQGETRTRKLELVARVGDVARRLPLGSVMGALEPLNQSVCGSKQVAYKKERGEVAKITFYIGGASTFAVRRVRPDLLEVASVSGPDGYCPANDCDVRRTYATIPIPADATIVEALRDISAPGQEAPFDCGGH